MVVLGGFGADRLAFETFVPITRHVDVHGLFGVGEIAPLLPEALGPTTGMASKTYTTGELRVGVEGRMCTESNHLCGVAGIDVGALTSLPSPTGNVEELSVIPRLGIETGGRTVRFRFVVEEATGLTYQNGRRDAGVQNLMIGPGLTLPL